MKKIRTFISKTKDRLRLHAAPTSIQMTISVSFTMISICMMCFLGVMLYQQFADRTETLASENAEQLLNQTAINLEDYLRSMRRISDAMYYSVIKDKDLAKESLSAELGLLYEANKDKLVSIACYTEDGDLIGASPIDTVKEDADVTTQKWFSEAVEQMENLHFSVPHVQDLFDDPSFRYYWVISLSRSVELTADGVTARGVLLVDMNYSGIEQLLDKANEDTSSQYVYLADSDGQIIYHPMQSLIYMGAYLENNEAEVCYEDGSTVEIFDGEERIVTVKTISYTGWKLISVVPKEAINMGIESTRYLAVVLVGLALLVLVIVNQLVSARIARPLKLLNDSVRDWESGNLKPDIYVGGPLEVEHLGRTLRSTVEQIRQLMQDILVEQEEKRKSELDALQSQINPHFLYNTLDSIVWMITGERYDEAVFMITQLASLFRISLSRGRTIISVEDECRHAQNYMNIQKIRYKNSFRVDFQIDPKIKNGCTVKLILQPLLENAIYYGMEHMGDEGEILVSGYKKDGDIYIEVCDNGLGMPEEEAAQLLKETEHKPRHGSGVGLLNVHNRIRLRFGARYGLIIRSAPDEGMTVTVHIPYIPYSEETRILLEEGKLLENGEKNGGSTDE